MIKFFRRIRQQLLTDNRLGKYFIYAIGEIFLVVIGILIALGINNWNQKRLKQIEEIKALNTVIEGLESDRRDIEFNIKISKQVVFSSEIIIKSFETNTAYHDSLAIHFSGSFMVTKFVGNEGPYEALKSKGLELISNDTLRTQIIEWYDYEYEALKNFTDGFFVSNDFIQTQIVKYFDIVELYSRSPNGIGPSKMTPHDFESLKHEKEFNTLLRTFRSQTNLYGIGYNQGRLSKLDLLTGKVKKEIERLKIL